MSPKSKVAGERTERRFLRQPPTEFIGALAHTKLPGEATRLMAYLYNRANPEKPMAFITLKNTARDMGIGERTVMRALDTLKAGEHIAVKVLPSGKRIVVVKPLPSPDRTPPATWAQQIAQVWDELGGPPDNSVTPPDKVVSGDGQDRQGTRTKPSVPPDSPVRENGETPRPARDSDDLITHSNHSPKHSLNHSPDGEGLKGSLVSDITEQCRKAAGWSWSERGRKGRRLFAANGTKDALDAWLAARGRRAGPLLNPITKDGAIRTDGRLSSQSVYLVVGGRGGEAGLKDFTPHDCRRWFASVLFESGADVLTVRQLLGHAKTDTTSLYDLRPEAARRKAVELLQVPYVSPKEASA